MNSTDIPDELFLEYIAPYLNKDDIIKLCSNQRFKIIVEKNLRTIIKKTKDCPDKQYINKCFEYFYTQSHDDIKDLEIFKRIVHFISSQTDKMHEEEFKIFSAKINSINFGYNIQNCIVFTYNFYYRMRVLHNFSFHCVNEMIKNDVHLRRPEWIENDEDISYVHKTLFDSHTFNFQDRHIDCILESIYSTTCLKNFMKLLKFETTAPYLQQPFRISIGVLCDAYFQVSPKYRPLLTKKVIQDNIIDIQTSASIINMIVGSRMPKKTIIDFVKEIESIKKSIDI